MIVFTAPAGDAADPRIEEVSLPFKEIGKHRWQVERRPGMNVPGILYASKALLDEAEKDPDAVQQVRNVACLPGIVGASLAMPDMHGGYGFPIGGVAAFDLEEGIISPGGVGYDINCGIRVITTDLDALDVRDEMQRIMEDLFRTVPTGLGTGGAIRLGNRELDRILEVGSKAVVEEGYGGAADLECTEASGRLPDADPDLVSALAKERGRGQLGTLGSGNHFLEADVVEEIYDEKTAQAFGLRRGRLILQIHCGSRGLGHQVCDDHLKVMKQSVSRAGIRLPDMQLACVPFLSPEGRKYFAAMSAAANFAWANRQVIMALATRSILRTLGLREEELRPRLLYDVAHNIAKVETHMVEGEKRKLVVHRKGATRAFPPGHPELPERYRASGQPVLIPGDMGRASYILAGRPGSMEQTFGSCCHGSGRRLSRHAAKKAAGGRSIVGEMMDLGIVVMCRSKSALAEEMSEAYKNVSDVVEVVHEAGLAQKVARLRPLGVIKG